MADKVILLDTFTSGYGMRARLALALKGVEYEHREEDLTNKSQLLLEMNPVHQKIPVLIHNAKSICESLIIVEYIDEVWSGNSPPLLLPSDPHERAQARFWADYIDKKLFVAFRRILFTKGEEREAAEKESTDMFKQLESVLGKKAFFGGHSLGFVDVALVPLTIWFYTYEKTVGFTTEEHCPKLISWAKRCIERESVSKSLPDPIKLYDYYWALKKKLGLE